MYRPHYPAEAIMQYSPAGGPVSMAADRRLLVSYDNYTAAQRAVDTLSDAGFPVENTAIVGSDLRLEETVTGRLTNGRAALSGLITGAVFGFVVGLFLGLFTSTTTSFFGLVLWSILWGAIAGAAFGFTSHAFTGGTRDFSSRSSIVAGRYDVLVASSLLDQAQALLQGGAPPADTVVVQRPPTAGPVTTSPAAADTAPQAAAYPAEEDRAVDQAQARDDDRADLPRGRRP
ncbi:MULTISPECIES: general stress protein [Microbispora]|uniref:General stress protein 17M-like domain-containing protein n=2 Tax=Microbispora hainanensis TaxID=568844 RepID=A0ABZ1T005_9ACTN|nr:MULTISPECIES: general stress protein [Microbispora]